MHTGQEEELGIPEFEAAQTYSKDMNMNHQSESMLSN